MSVQTRATIDDLYRVEGKAELIGGRIVRYMASGFRPSRAAFRIGPSLDDYATQVSRGYANADGLGYVVPELPSGRESFEPDASYYDGHLPANEMRFIEGPPTFAVEVRSENDYGPVADSEYAAKRDDYFQAGTKAVWDVAPLARTIHCYTAAAPTQPRVFSAGDTADAEPAVPGWRVAVDWVFG
ncbi:MAG TPA: Uma2 family endonuclease [Gemmataceae bacterium]|nr:Uma2 family endonuclease [Gemmataceae bacterium]